VCGAAARPAPAAGFRVCAACGLHFAEAVDADAIARSYAKLLDAGDAAAIEAHRRPVYEAALEAIGPPRGARCLDVGCGAGEFVALARVRGLDAIGVDAAAGARHPAARVLRATFPCPGELGAARFDLVTFFNSLNYIDDPVAALREAHRLLHPGGRVVVRVPNVAVHAAVERVAAHPAGRVLPLGWRDGAALRHPRGFTPRALDLALRRGGFVDVRVQPSVVPRDPYATGEIGAALARRVATVVTTRLARWSGHRLLLAPSLLAFARRDASAP
jgi:SAM-dependent methyltransferase